MKESYHWGIAPIGVQHDRMENGFMRLEFEPYIKSMTCIGAISIPLHDARLLDADEESKAAVLQIAEEIGSENPDKTGRCEQLG